MERRNRLGRLEGVRGFAAAVVLLGHAQFATSGVLAILLSAGQEAVIVFFLLSGFVVHYATLGRGRRPPPFVSYFLRRFRRIYPLFAVSLLLTYLSHCVLAGQWTGPHPAELAGNLAMLQDMPVGKRGVWVGTYLDNWPLWSLAYEWWFYMLFFPVAVGLAIPPRRQRYVVVGLSLAGFVGYHLRPNAPSLYLSYFVIWWAGVELSREHADAGRLTWRTQRSNVAALAAFAALWAVPVAIGVSHHARMRFGIEPVLQFRHFAAGTATVVVGLAWYKAGFRGFAATVGPFAAIAPISYALYVCHVPVYWTLAAVLPRATAVVRFAASLVVLIPLAYVLEIRLQRRITTVFNRLDGFLTGPAGSAARRQLST